MDITATCKKCGSSVCVEPHFTLFGIPLKYLIDAAREKMAADNRKVIWCYDDGKTVSPIGEAKTYAKAIGQSERKYPETFKLYELVEVKGEPS